MKVTKYSPILFNGPEAGAGAVPAAPVAEPAAAAPEAGGQGEATGSGLYSLDQLPEDVRSLVEPTFKEWEGNVTREFQKRSEALSAWKPYDELGVRDIPAEDMQHLVSFYEIASDPDKFEEWVKSTHASLVGEETTAPGAAPEGAAPEAGEEDRSLTRAEAEQLYQEQRAAEQQEQENQRIQDEIALEMRSTFDELGIGGDDKKSEDLRDLVAFFAQKHQDGEKPLSEVLKAGHAEYLSMIGAAKSDAIDEKLAQPKPAETAGKPVSTPTQATSFDEAKERTKARLQAART
jgi:hypothetical protein